MNASQKSLYLHHLYTLRSLGESFIDPVVDKKRQKSPKSLDVSMDKLAHMTQGCHLCDLSKSRNKVVFGAGSLTAEVMFIGEAPGANEDVQGKPFVGRAGELLSKIITNVLHLEKDAVFIANVIKCRPPNNRVPTELEVSMCLPYLLRQIEIVSPKVIVLLGATSYRYLMKDATPISKVRGQILRFKEASVIPTYHPSYLLRNSSAKKDVYVDMLKVKGLL